MNMFTDNYGTGLYNINNHNIASILKILVIGDSGVGKTTFIRKYCENIYNDNYCMTIGIDYACKTVSHNDNNIKLHIWDIGGNHNYMNLIRHYYSDSFGIILCFDISNRKSFDNLDVWMEHIKQYTTNRVSFILLGLKQDNDKIRTVSHEDIINFMNDHKDENYINDIIYIEESSKYNEVNVSFNKLITVLCHRINNGENNINRMINNKPPKKMTKNNTPFLNCWFL